MHKLVWTENSLDSISLHFVQEYVIKWHRYITPNGPCKLVPMVYKGQKSSFMSLAWPWSGRSLPQGEPVGVLGPWTGAQCDQTPSSPTTNFVTNLKSERLTFLHMAGWLANCSWLTDYLKKCQPDPPKQRHLVAKCITTLVRFTWGQMYPSGRDILWPSVIILQVRLTCLFEGKSGASSQNNFSSISIY